MRVLLSASVALLASGCGSNDNLNAASPSNPTSAMPAAPDPASRGLAESECVELGQAMLDVCNHRGNSRSSQIDGYCSDLQRTIAESDAWLKTECLPHVRYIDSTCFRSATSVSVLMDCDRAVDHTTVTTRTAP
ncbi:MAG: hypothetical protein ABTD50_11865 [Polyangiaceae bacterium]|jgi:hypothetical protein